jgi:type VI protein secretion system component Hcp
MSEIKETSETAAVSRAANLELNDHELNIVTGGSNSTGGGAGKVTFNEFHVTRKSDQSSPIFF